MSSLETFGEHYCAVGQLCRVGISGQEGEIEGGGEWRREREKEGNGWGRRLGGKILFFTLLSMAKIISRRIETRNQEEISISSHILPRGLSVAEGP